MARVNISRTRKIAFAHKVTDPYVRQTAYMILGGARRLAPSGDHRSGSGSPAAGQPLRNSLELKGKAVTINTIRERVGSTNKYAATVHQGSSSHTIRSKKGKMLRFQWERGELLLAARAGRRGRGRRLRTHNGFFFFASVRHPGNKRPVRYLTTPMHTYGRLRGFRTSSTPASRTRLP